MAPRSAPCALLGQCHWGATPHGAGTSAMLCRRSCGKVAVASLRLPPPVKNACILEMELFKIPEISTRQTERTRARTHAQEAETANRLLSSCSIGSVSISGKENPSSSKLKKIFRKIAFPAKQQEPWNLKEPCFAFHTAHHSPLNSALRSRERSGYALP